MWLEKKISSTIFLFPVKMESVTTTYPHLLALQKPTNDGDEMSTKFFLMVFQSCQALHLILIKNVPMKHLSTKLLSSNLQKVRAARRECTHCMPKETTEVIQRGETGKKLREDDLEEVLHQGLHLVWPNLDLSPMLFLGQTTS